MKLAYLVICTFVCVFGFQLGSSAQTQTFTNGSAIIDMGSASPTVANSLKPYGLIYALLKYQNVPVNAVISQSKVKDGIDFTYNSKAYKGGTYIVSADFITSSVTSLLNAWAGQGVLIDYVNSTDLTVNVTYKLNFAPKWVMDKANGNIAVNFLNNAGIPSSAFSFKSPFQLGDCDDIFILPHADPTWATHNNLYFWNKNQRGAIWAGCHAVSVLENITKDTTIGGTATTLQMNFLSTTGLVPFTDHVGGTTPFTSSNPTDPMAQYIGKTDNAQLAGSETVFLPKIGSAWRSTTKMITSSSVQTDIPSLSAGPAALNIYGRGFDGATNGYVCYEASHNIGSSSLADNIAAERLFFNFSFIALNDKVSAKISASITGGPSVMNVNTASSLFTSSVAGDGGPYTYKWSANVAGDFSTATSSSTTFTPASSVTPGTKCVITIVVTDANCSRLSFDAKKVTILAGSPPPSPPSAATILKTISGDCAANSTITFNVFDSNVDATAGTRAMTSLTGLANGTVVSSTSGSITYTPGTIFRGIDVGTYTFSNTIGGTSVTTSGTISITVGDLNLIPQLSDDALTTLVDNSTQINVLANDKNTPFGVSYDSLYIRDITTKPTKGGFVYINTNGTLSYLSKNGPSAADVTAGDSFKYMACNKLGYCAVATVTVTLINDVCGTSQYQLTTTGTAGTAVLTSSADSYMLTGSLTNFGAIGNFLINGNNVQLRKPLVKYSVLIPSNATITSAIQAFTVTPTLTTALTGFTNPFSATIYALKQPWVEGEVNNTNYATTPSNLAWGSAGAATAGTDYTDLGSSNPVIINPGNVTLTAGSSVLSSTDMTSIVQSWVTTPTTNYGVLIVPKTAAVSGTVGFFSREGGTSSTAPRINVNYTYIPCLNVSAANYKPVAYPDTASTKSNTTITINAKTNDLNYYSNTNNITAVSTPAHGTATFTASTVVYTPTGDFVGVDTLTYTLTDQTNSMTSTATIRITVNRVAPKINPDFATTNSNTAVVINVGANDSDPQGSLDVPVITVTSKYGTASITNTNSILYTPSDKYTGKDTLIYSRSNISSDACNTVLSDTAIVFITIVNQPPTAGNDSIVTYACTLVDIDIKANDVDPEGKTLTVVFVTNPTNGTVALNTNGKYRYTPNANFTGTDQFTYKVKDGSTDSLVSNTATVKITISAVANPNTSPVAVADFDSTSVNQVVNTNVMINDSDPQNDVLSINITAPGLKAPSNGTIQILANKMIRYTPNTGFTGTDTYEYQITDLHPSCSGNSTLAAKALVTIKVIPPPILTGGTIWFDADYSANDTFDNIKTNSETGTNVNGSIYVYLVDSTGTIVDQTAADNAGVYLLVNVPSNTPKLSIILSTAVLTKGGKLTAPSLPSGYTNTSPSVRTFTSGSTDITGYDFGIVTSSVTGGTISATSAGFCITGTPGIISSTGSSTGAISTQWQVSTTSGGSGFTNIAGASGDTYTPPAAITTTTWYRRKAIGTSPAYAYSNVVKIAINQLPVIIISPATSTIAPGSNATLTASGAITYAWSPATNLSSTTGASVVVTPVATGSATYTVTGTDDLGCVGTKSIIVSQVPIPVAGAISVRSM